MFGVGPSELVMVFLLVLLLFGPSKLPQMARDIGRFVGEARRSIDEFKDELTSIEDEEKDKPASQQRRKDTPSRKEKEPTPANRDGSAGADAEKEEEYDF